MKKMESCQAEHFGRLSIERILGPFKELGLGDASVYGFAKCSAVLSLFHGFLRVSLKLW